MEQRKKEEGRDMIVWMFIFLFAAVFFDWRDFKIPNLLTGGGALITAGICLYYGYRLKDLLPGTVIPFILCIGLFYLGVLGGGDVKLLMVCGMPLGGRLVIQLLVLSFFWNGLYAAIFLWQHKAFRQRFSYLYHFISTCLKSGHIHSYDNVQVSSSKDAYLHFSVGVLLAYLTMYAGGMLLWMF